MADYSVNIARSISVSAGRLKKGDTKSPHIARGVRIGQGLQRSSPVSSGGQGGQPPQQTQSAKRGSIWRGWW